MNNIKTDISLKELTTMHVECRAASLYSPGSVEELQDFISHQQGRYVVIGNGSKVLFTGDWTGIVVLLNKFNKIMDLAGEEAERIFVNCQAGVTIHELLEFCIRKGYTGMEFLAGIPGTIGGSTYVNAGAYGKSIGDVVQSLRTIDEEGRLQNYDKGKVRFQYRQSDIKGIIVEVTFSLSRGNPREVTQKIEEILSDRKKLPEGWSCGCIFKNPEGISVGKLIEECGLKGYRVGDAEISPIHGNFIINHGDAKAGDILELMKIMKEAVRKRFDIELNNEIRLL
jgi:UDP-N-acetylmuramate dehydrogenase